MRPLGPGMMQQIQQPCSNCRQTGFAPPPHDTCPDVQRQGGAALPYCQLPSRAAEACSHSCCV